MSGTGMLFVVGGGPSWSSGQTGIEAFGLKVSALEGGKPRSATFIGVIVGTAGKGPDGRIAVSTVQFAALKALLKKVGPDLGEIETSASAVSPAALAMDGTAKANTNMKTAIAELKSFIILSCQM
jgi:hypothetical protein